MKKIFILLIIMFAIVSTTNVAAQNKQTVETDSATTLIQKVEKWYENNMNYLSITALMTVESSFIPFPSEIVIPPAAYIASKPDSHLNIFLVVLFGTIGALLGAYINYFLALWLGRMIIYRFSDSKWGKMLLLSSEKVKKSEVYFNKHGNVSTFVGRLIPGIRQLISIPAGLAKMNFASFTIYTILGAGVWNCILALLGYLAHGQADLIDKYSHELSIAVLALLAVIVVFFAMKYFLKRRSGKKQ